MKIKQKFYKFFTILSYIKLFWGCIPKSLSILKIECWHLSLLCHRLLHAIWCDLSFNCIYDVHWNFIQVEISRTQFKYLQYISNGRRYHSLPLSHHYDFSDLQVPSSYPWNRRRRPDSPHSFRGLECSLRWMDQNDQWTVTPSYKTFWA